MLLYDVLPALSAKTVPLTLTLFHEYAELKPDTNDKSKREIIYVRYNDIDMKYVYMCSTCNTSWKTSMNN